MENQEKKFDITKYPEGPLEIIKYMDYLDEDGEFKISHRSNETSDDARLAILWGFVYKTFSI